MSDYPPEPAEQDRDPLQDNVYAFLDRLETLDLVDDVTDLKVRIGNRIISDEFIDVLYNEDISGTVTLQNAKSVPRAPKNGGDKKDCQDEDILVYINHNVENAEEFCLAAFARDGFESETRIIEINVLVWVSILDKIELARASEGTSIELSGKCVYLGYGMMNVANEIDFNYRHMCHDALEKKLVINMFRRSSFGLQESNKPKHVFWCYIDAARVTIVEE